VVRVTQAFIDLLKKSSDPVFVNVSSSQGSITLHSDPSYKYYDNKGVVLSFFKSSLEYVTVVLAYELKDTNFKVNAICPGYTKQILTGIVDPELFEDAGKTNSKIRLIDKRGRQEIFLVKKTNLKQEIFPGNKDIN